MFLTKVASNASIASLFPLTFDSYMKNSHFKRKQNLTYSSAMIQVAVVWILGIAYALFFPLVYEMVEKVHQYPYDPIRFWSTNMCDFAPIHAQVHKIFLMVDMFLLYIIPIIILGSMNIQIFWWQWKGLSKTEQEIDEKGRAAVTKAGVIFLTVFVFCNLGNYTIMMYIDWGPRHFWDVHLWQAVAALIGYAQSWLNVLFVFLFNKPFRQAIRRHKVRGKEEKKKDMSEMNELKNGSKENITGIEIRVEDVST
jgi:hypothetical protein